ncbi:hypothetical protein TNCV_4236651 [Trichonephila clavipes]|nr:hypothetical protein TNCV_4236651 [Trichonephila clavipes]
MGHEDELTTEKRQEILNEEHQETERSVSPSEQEEDERGPMPTSAIKDLLKKGNRNEFVNRDVMTTQTDSVNRLHAACTSVDTRLLQRVHSLIPWHSQAYHDIHGGHFEHFPLKIFANTVVDESNTMFYSFTPCFSHFLVNYRSYRHNSLDSFYVLPTRNLAVQSICGSFGIPRIYKIEKKWARV